MADHSEKVGFGLSTSQIVSSDFTACVVPEQALNLQEQAGGKHNFRLTQQSNGASSAAKMFFVFF